MTALQAFAIASGILAFGGLLVFVAFKAGSSDLLSNGGASGDE